MIVFGLNIFDFQGLREGGRGVGGGDEVRKVVLLSLFMVVSKCTNFIGVGYVNDFIILCC